MTVKPNRGQVFHVPPARRIQPGGFNRGQVFHVPLAPKQITGAEVGLMRADASVDRRQAAPQVGRNLPHAVSVLRIGVEQGGDVVTTRDEILKGGRRCSTDASGYSGHAATRASWAPTNESSPSMSGCGAAGGSASVLTMVT